MAGTLTVQNIEGPSSGANANKVIIPGHVIQVVHARTNTEVSGDTTTYTDTTLSASITPTSTSSKILIRVNQHIIEALFETRFGVAIEFITLKLVIILLASLFIACVIVRIFFIYDKGNDTCGAPQCLRIRCLV